MTPLEKLKVLSKESGEPLKDLTVLAPQNDSFRIGTPTQVEQAEWFSSIWEQEDFPYGTHLRRIHYRMVSKANFYLPDGSPYENSMDCWLYLQKVSKYARTLGLVNPRMFADRRNPEPHICVSPEQVKPYLETSEPSCWLPSIAANVSHAASELMHRPSLMDYSYRNSDQPYLVEIWIEKSTLDDELRPLCQSMGVNLVTSKGFASHTAALNMIDRCKAHNKPGRILYISDFDPAGDDMPGAVARMLEFRKDDYPNLHITLEPILMTPEIALEYNLPRTPVNGKAKTRFEAFHGEGGVELDALEALYPGETVKLVRKAIQQYRDNDIQGEIAEAEEDASLELSDQWMEIAEPLEREWQDISKDSREVAGRYRARLRLLSERMEREMKPIQEQADELLGRATDAFNAFCFDIPDRPLSTGDTPGNAIDHYFDSSREYLEQLEYHKRRKGK